MASISSSVAPSRNAALNSLSVIGGASLMRFGLMNQIDRTTCNANQRLRGMWVFDLVTMLLSATSTSSTIFRSELLAHLLVEPVVAPERIETV